MNVSYRFDMPLTAYPTLRDAAEIIGVSPSTLSRRSDLRFELMGARDKRVPASEVIRLAVLYRRRAVRDVAEDLLIRAATVGGDAQAAVRAEIARELSGHSSEPVTPEAFLAEARRRLPGHLYRKVVAAYQPVSDRRGERDAWRAQADVNVAMASAWAHQPAPSENPGDEAELEEMAAMFRNAAKRPLSEIPGPHQQYLRGSR